MEFESAVMAIYSSNDQELSVLKLIKSSIIHHDSVIMLIGTLILNTGILYCRRTKINLLKMLEYDLHQIMFNRRKCDGLIPINALDYAFVEVMNYFGQHNITQCSVKKYLDFTSAVVPKYVMVQRSSNSKIILPQSFNHTHIGNESAQQEFWWRYQFPIEQFYVFGTSYECFICTVSMYNGS